MSLSSLPVWHDERLLFMRERAAGAYGTAAYFVAVVLFDLLPMRVIPPIYFTALSYWMIGLRQVCCALQCARLGWGDN
jgi:ABC-2 type transporter